jgi:hypothetical protein
MEVDEHGRRRGGPVVAAEDMWMANATPENMCKRGNFTYT